LNNQNLYQGEPGQTDDTREEVRQMQMEIDELRRENNALKIQIEEVTSNMP